VHLLEQFPEAGARPLHSHLQGRYPIAGDLRHLFIAQLFDVFHEECFALFHVELLQRVLHIVERVTLVDRRIDRRFFQSKLVANDATLAPAAPNDIAPTLVRDDPIEPRGEPPRIAAPVQRAIRADERGLHHVLCIIAIADHADSKPRVSIAIPATQLRECIDVAFGRSADQLFIGSQAHNGLTAESALQVTTMYARVLFVVIPVTNVTRSPVAAVKDAREQCASQLSESKAEPIDGRRQMMKNYRIGIAATLAAASLTFMSACSDAGSPAGVGDNSSNSNTSGSGTVAVRLTDAPFSSDSVKSVDIFVVRVDARASDADSATADHALSSDSAESSGWKTLATPNASFNLLSLQNGISAALGQASIPAGTYSGLRLIIDPSQSSVTLKNGTKLTNTSSPSVTFPSAARSGIKIVLSQPVPVVANTTTTLLVDFDVNNSFVQRGNTIDRNGLLFKPVIKATITNTATTNATVRLINATSGALSFLENGTAVTGGNSIAYGASSSCVSVPISNAGLTVTQSGSTTALGGFTPTLTAGTSTSFIAYNNATNGVSFATLGNAFTPASGQSGFRVFNATTATTGYDVFVTALNAALGTATATNVLAGASSAFVSVPAGSQQIRITTTGGTTIALDLGAQALVAGQNYTLVIAPPGSGSTAPRAFLVAGC